MPRPSQPLPFAARPARKPLSAHSNWLARGGRVLAGLMLAALVATGGQPHAVQAAPATPLPLPLLVFAGQSNMIGWLSNVDDLTPEQRQPQPQVLFFGPNEDGHTWGTLVPPTVITNGLTNTVGLPLTNKGFGPEISTGLFLTTLAGFGLVAEVKYGEVGTDLDYWWKASSGPTYNRMLDRVAEAQSALSAAYPDRAVYVAGFFWMQGEADALNVNGAALRYEANLIDLIAAVRTKFSNPDLPIVLGQIRGGHHEAGIIRAAQANVGASVPNVSVVGTDDLPYDPSDGLHFTSAGIYTLGERFGNAFARLAILTRKVYLPLALR
jgi:hypothetical protein